MIITPQAAAERLAARNHIAILAHNKPDGDTLGSCFALLYALEALGKTARVECADGFPERYGMICGGYSPKPFAPQYVVACDVAGADLLGGLETAYPAVDLCIDHHKSNTLFAACTVLDPAAAAAAQILHQVIRALGVRPDFRIATALYTGLSTDTGCFRFANVTSAALRLAAEMIDCGADYRLVNKRMFDSKSRGRIAVEQAVMQTLEYSHGGRCAIITLPHDVYERYGVTEDDLDGLSALPRRIEGVLCGIMIKEQQSGSHRISMRCDPPLDASAICQLFGGGGHTGAAGCNLTGSLEAVKQRLREAVGDALHGKERPA